MTGIAWLAVTPKCADATGPRMVLGHLKFAIIGVGNMGLALMRGLLDSEVVAPEGITIRNRRPTRSAELAETYGVKTAESNASCVRDADVVLIAVKPQIFSKILNEIRAELKPDAMVMSVAAGITTGRMESELGGTPRVVRAMPNTPSLIKQGATAICAGTYTTEEDLDRARHILEPISLVVTVDESHMDAVTGLSGSGPAYIMLIIEAFADAGVKVGMSREIAQELAVQTIKGSAAMLQETREHPGRLKDQVTSPGGTAIAGLHTLEQGGLRTTIMNAVEDATKRAQALGES